MVGTGGLYAPTIRHHNGRTYIICTNVIHGPSNELGDERNEQFIIHTTDIRSGNWSDPIIFEFPGIDPSLLFDDDGRVYVQLCKTGPEFHIYNLEINIETGIQLVEPTLIWTGWKKGYTEGPHVYRKDGWYYLLCAEGGTFRYHMLSMARSKSIWGPYEAYEKNPLYTASGTAQYVQNTGHGDLFQDQHGQWWVVMIGIRNKEGRCIMGRETFLTAVDWPSDGWPKIAPVTAEGDSGAEHLSLQGQDSAAWVYLRDAKLDRYRMHDGHIMVKADVVELTSPDESTAFVGQRPRRLQGTATVALYRPQDPTPVHAGLALYKDEHRFLTIGYDSQLQEVIFQGLNQAKFYSTRDGCSVQLQQSLSLKIDYTETSLKFSFQAEKGNWHELSTVDTAILTDYDFTGPVIGVFAIGKDVAVEFGDFQIDAV